MIGLIRFDFRGGIAEAVLGNDGCWSCAAAPCLIRPLDILYSPIREGLPAGGPAGRRHLEAAARWLKGIVKFQAGCPIVGTTRPSVRDVLGIFSGGRSRGTEVRSRERSDRVTDRDAAKMCGVGLGMIRLWVETGVWPMPQLGGSAPPTFRRSEVKGWIATGTWPSGVHFRT